MARELDLQLSRMRLVERAVGEAPPDVPLHGFDRDEVGLEGGPVGEAVVAPELPGEARHGDPGLHRVARDDPRREHVLGQTLGQGQGLDNLRAPGGRWWRPVHLDGGSRGLHCDRSCGEEEHAGRGHRRGRRWRRGSHRGQGGARRHRAILARQHDDAPRLDGLRGWRTRGLERPRRRVEDLEGRDAQVVGDRSVLDDALGEVARIALLASREPCARCQHRQIGHERGALDERGQGLRDGAQVLVASQKVSLLAQLLEQDGRIGGSLASLVFAERRGRLVRRGGWGRCGRR